MAWTEPHTYLPGELVTAATLNVDWRDNQSYLVGDTAWIAPTLLNGWVNYGAPNQVAGYRKVGDLVFLRGTVKSGTVGTGTPVFTLPAGYRPPVQYARAVPSNNALGRVDVYVNGNVVVNFGSNLWVALDGYVVSVV